VAWDIQFSPEAEAWWDTLTDEEQQAMAGALDQLEEHGPGLRRPVIGNIVGSRHANMKELVAFGGNLRALFAFDPERRALVLLGGDKTDDWVGWYQRNIPIADDLFDDYLKYLKDSGG
jgi:hypothetical protein